VFIPRCLCCSLAGVLTLVTLSCGPSARTVEERKVSEEQQAPYPKLSFTTGRLQSWVDKTLESMTLEEKVGQLIMARAFGHYISTQSDEFERLARLVQDLKIGGVAMFQGDIYETAVLLNKLQELSKVPLLVAGDFERGIAMRIRRGTYFPDAMALGATRNPDYAYRVGWAVAKEARAIGVHQNFAPVADVNNNPANPVINTRSFGENAALVSRMVSAYVRGLNEGGMISTAKHFPGHGDTGTDSHIDLPVLPFDRRRLDSLELVSFKGAIDSGVMSVMIAHLAVPALDTAEKLPTSLSPVVIERMLKTELGFQGLVVTDALDMAGLMRGYSVGDAAVKAVKAGADIVLMPSNEQVAIDALLGAVRSGQITEQRLNESVMKLLMVKQWLHLDEEKLVEIEGISDHVATRDHLALAKQVARDAVTVVRNDSNLLPLQQYGKKKLLVIILSDTDDNRTEINRPTNQYPNEPFGAYFSQQVRRRYGSVETFRLTPSSNTLLFDSVLTRMRRADIVLMPLYVKVRSATGKIGIPENMSGFLARASELQKPTVVVSFGNPYVLSTFPKAQALMCAYTDAEVMVEAAVEALFGEIEVHGRLPVTIPDQFQFGSGVHFAQSYLRKNDPSSAGFEPERLERLDDVITQAIRDSAFPGAQLVVVKDNIIAYSKAFGTYSYEPSAREIDHSTLYDLASLTKVVATTAAIMKLFDQGKVSLDDSVFRYIPKFSEAKKSAVTLRHLLLHTGGLPPFRKLYDVCKTSEEALDSIYATPLVATPGDTTIYSDLGMIILGKIVESVSGMSLAAFVGQEFYQPLRMTSTTFNPTKGIWAQIAPTELDTVWRKMLVQGTVHDENAALLGGMAGNAGLFSTASDLSIFMQMIMNRGTYGGQRYLSENTVTMFTRRDSPSSKRAFGWDLKSTNGSSAGELFSVSSFGHTGFTGTSVWADPTRNLFVVFLSNRVHPTRSNMKITKVRSVIHNAVIQALEGPASTGEAATKQSPQFQQPKSSP